MQKARPAPVNSCSARAGRVALGLPKRIAQRTQHRFVAGIEPLRPIEGDDVVAVAPLDQDGLLIHGLPRSCRAVRSYWLRQTNCEATT